MRYGCGYPMGPLALLDLIGLDTAYEILETMYRQGRDRLHAPSPILKQMVTAGMLGRKTGRGFYTYEAPDSPVVVADDRTPSADEKPQLRHDIRPGRRRRHRDHGQRHRRGLRQERLRRAVRRPLGQDKVDGVVAAVTKNFDKQIQRGRATEEAKAEVLARISGSTSLDDLADRRHRRRGDRRGPRDQDHALREPRRDLQARCDPRDHHLEPADHRLRPGDVSGRRTSSACTSSTRRRS